MNKTILLTTIFILGLSTVANTQEPISFRSNALGGIIEDDLDLVYDPIELQFVEGIRLYTDRKSVVQGKSVDLGGRRIIKKKKYTKPLITEH